ncbi:tRNA (adenosine(37)-N6)-threonylcarbamoyltransferase complex transferase subunit TsaD [bacterium]|nr:tRNA (adenosine(37)-N6)-threonylcarbamoyltransferase complex transferase subunit TsaD [bacterium]
MYILGIDTSCDDTSVAVVKEGKKVLSSIVSSQINLHTKYGGVVPEIASRSHVKMINLCLEESFKKAEIRLEEIGAVAVTYGPGLIGSLLIGLQTAKAISFAYQVPLIGLNHLESHLYSPFLEFEEIKYPILSLIASGGHTELVYIKKPEEYKLICRTDDDAAGEAYDKVAKLLNLGYPGGPVIERLAKIGDKNKIKFPKVKWKTKKIGFSFSGLKTAVKYFLMKNKLSTLKVEDIAASFQEALINILFQPLKKILGNMEIKSAFLVGGVAANSTLRERFVNIFKDYNIKTYCPSKEYCTDNAAMVAGLGYLKYKSKRFSHLKLDAVSRICINTVGNKLAAK